MTAVQFAIVTGLFVSGCNECEPDGGLGPSVEWRLVHQLGANTGEPLEMELVLRAGDVVDGMVLDHHCEPVSEPMDGTVRVQPTGGDAIVETVRNGEFEITIPYSDDTSFEFEASDGRTFMERWQLPPMFEVAATTVGSSLHVTWTTPTPLAAGAPTWTYASAVRNPEATWCKPSSIRAPTTCRSHSSRTQGRIASRLHARIRLRRPARSRSWPCTRVLSHRRG